MNGDKRPPTDLTATEVRIEKPGDIMELFARGSRSAILLDTQVRPDFFDLSSGFAGDVVQKCVNYGLRMAIVRTSEKVYSTSFEQFASETTRRGQFVFARSVEEARAILNS